MGNGISVAVAPAREADVVVGLGGEEGRQVAGVVGGALERAEESGQGAGAGNGAGAASALIFECFTLLPPAHKAPGLPTGEARKRSP